MRGYETHDQGIALQSAYSEAIENDYLLLATMMFYGQHSFKLAAAEFLSKM